jgi:CheY-like chemotaxis protein
MLSRILHIEDDLALRGLVELTLESLGFRGTFLTAGTVAEAIAELDEAARNTTPVDLILCDMSLPDGTGLEVVRYVRASETWRTTPLLILSAGITPRNVGRAYALGANACIDKSASGRTLSQALRSLYEHWAKDALLPPAHLHDRMQQYIRAAIALRTRHAQLYQRMAERFGNTPSEAAFWNSRSLAESNMINLLGFLRLHCEEADLPTALLDELADMQAATERALDATEQAIDGDSTARAGAYRCIVDLVSQTNVDAVARVISLLFPIHPVAMETLRDLLFATVEDVAAWVDLHTTDPTLRRSTAQLRSKLAPLTAQAGAVQ